MTTTTQAARRHRLNEAEAVMRINSAVAQAQDSGTVIDRGTARLIAAAVHRGIGGELELFASTGRMTRHQVARLELFHSAADEPAYTMWRTALRQFITADARHGRTGGSTSRRPRQILPSRRGHRRRVKSPTTPLPQANSDPVDCGCDSKAAVAYVRTGAGDDHVHDGLALHTQASACRRYVRDRLHKRLEATFSDRAASLQAGFRKLLNHLRTCHNRRVVVPRLDRLPTVHELRRVHDLGARVLSTSEPNPRTPRREADIALDLQAPPPKPAATNSPKHDHG